MRTTTLSGIVLIVAMLVPAATAADRPSDVPAALQRMPVREVTVFKDGHAFVLREGRMPADENGDVVLDQLPAPVLGTFWPYVNEPGAKLVAVTAAKERVAVERTALDLRTLIEANIGASVWIEDVNDGSFAATIAAVPQRSAIEIETTSTSESGAKIPEKGNVVLLKRSSGTLAVPFDQIRRVTFTEEHKTKLASDEMRNRLTLDIESTGGSKRRDALVGMMYLERGIRWIPGYKLEIDGEGQATLKLQATLINELIDLEDVTAHLVVGVPSFAFKDTPDPISLQDAAAQLGRYFDSGSQTAYALSNALMTQDARMGEYRSAIREVAVTPGGGLGPTIDGAEREEDLYVFTLRHVSVAKGARLVVPVSEYRIEYRDIYTLDIPFMPPPELRQQIGDARQAELARLHEAPKAQHVLRLRNSTDAPFTTAPTLVLTRGRVLGQGLLTYTSVGGETDLPVTAAVDLRVKKSERETGRTPNALTRSGATFSRVDLAGSIAIENYGKEPAELEVTRRVLGHVGEADHAGKAEMLSAFEESLGGERGPVWWGWVSWPGGWHHANGIGRFTWKAKLAPGEKIDLGYTWHYFWPQ